VQLSYTEYRSEQDLYRAAMEVAWEIWFTPKQSIKVEVTAQHSPLNSLNFAALKIKDAVCDRFRDKAHGVRPDVNTQWPDVRIYAHLTTDTCSLYIDTSGEPLFKRGWREDKGEAPLKETLAAAMLAACGWADGDGDLLPLYDPCCGSGTIAIEAAQIACHIPPGMLRRFAFEKYLPFQGHVWDAIKKEAADARLHWAAGQKPLIFGSDVAHRMVDFAQRNAQRAGVADVIEFRGGDALQRMPPSEVAGVMLLNPPYGERIGVGGVSGTGARRSGPVPRNDVLPDFEGHSGAREQPVTEDGGEFFSQLATHWKKNYPGWTGWILTPDLKLPGKMRLKESRRIPLWNGPIECRLFKFDMVRGSARDGKSTSGRAGSGNLGSDSNSGQ
jgi:putative N6-adenine-specific DNA methylase